MGKKVAQVITLSEMGGAQKHILLLSEELKGLGNEVTVFAAGGGDLVKLLRDSEIKFIEVPDMVREINPVRDLKALIFLYQKFKKDNYEVIHCHSSKAGLLGRIAGRLAGCKKVIYTVHGFVFNEPMGKVKRIIYKMIERVGSIFGTDIIAVSKKDYEDAITNRMGNKNNTRYIPNAINRVELSDVKPKEDIRKELGIAKDEIVIGTVANFYDTKGHKYMIEAVKRLYDEKHSFKTVLAGTGPRFEEIKEACRDYANIMFLGYRKDNMDVINSMDLFLLPSVKEGMPYVILEAMSLRKPVLCTRVGALTDIIDNKTNGIIVNPGSSEEIYSELRWAIENQDELCILGENGYRYVNKEFSMEAFMKSILEVYEK